MVEFTAKAVPLADLSVAELPVLPFADDAFDVVAANFALDHVGWPRRALVELGRTAGSRCRARHCSPAEQPRQERRRRPVDRRNHLSARALRTWPTAPP